LHQQVSGFDEVICPDDADFASSGLKPPSLNRLGFLAVMPEKEIPGVIVTISSMRPRRLLKTLGEYLVEGA
jgi:mRNA interferase MazF